MESTPFVGFRMSPLQKAVWQAQGAVPGYVFCRASLEGEVDSQQLRRSFEIVAERHESLRTVFQQPAGFAVPFQVVQDSAVFTWESFDVSDQEPSLRGAAAEHLLDSPAWPASSLTGGSVFAVRLVRTASSDYLLAVRIPVLCGDPESAMKLITEAANSYAGSEAVEAVQYADFSEWHNELLASPDAESVKEFWAAPRSTQRIPFQRRTPLPATDSRGSVNIALDPAVVQAAGSPEFLLACWQATLARLTGQHDITVSSVSSGRPLEDLSHSIGLFALPLPINASFAEKQSFREAIGQAAEALARAEEAQSYCPVEANADTTGFEFLTIPVPLSAGNLKFTVLDAMSDVWNFKLSLVCAVRGGKATADSVELHLSYNASLFEEADIRRLARCFERAVHAAVAEPDRSVSSFELTDEAERDRVINAFNADAVDYGDARCFHELFEAQAKLTPDRLALVFRDTSLTYAELNSRANRIAHVLRAAGVSPGAGVGLCLERSAEMIVALLGVLKAGGAYVPLLPDLPSARLAHQISETGTRAIVSVEPLLTKLPEFAGRVLLLDRDRDEIAGQPDSDLRHTTTGDDPIYILYTSGSTGLPKGVAVRHANMANYARGICRRLGLSILTEQPGLTFATVSTLGADLGNTSVFPPLISGGCVSVIDYDAALDGMLFAERNRRHPIDVLKITPSNLHALMSGSQPELVLPARFLMVGGEACSWDLVQRVHAAGRCRMINHYGPTEATVGCLTYEIAASDDPAEALAATVPVGRPLPNLQVYVLDSELRPVPVSVPGEICVSGAGIAGGYVGRPDETAQKFVANPFRTSDAKLYRTGDLGRFLPDGSIEFLGRADNQVKIRGYRVELAEIETVLCRFHGVAQAIVILSQDDAGQHLTAFVAASPQPSPDLLRSHLRDSLPEYMVPAELVVLLHFPLNANGKVDRRALADMNPGSAPARDEIAEPTNELEERLLAIWRQVLNVERIGIRDNFFDLGGHSLLATQMISRMRADLRLQVTIRMLFEAPTIESLARAISTLEADDDPEIGDLLAELEELSDADAGELLGASGRSGAMGKE